MTERAPSVTSSDARRAELGRVLMDLDRQVRGASEVGRAHARRLHLLLASGDRETAEAALDAALLLRAATPDALDALAFYARQLDRHALSNTLYRRAAALAPGDARLLFNLATSERSLGRLADAAAACDQALRLAPDDPAALLLRSELGHATPERNNLAALEARLAADSSDATQISASYALGKERHELGDYPHAFAAFQHGARTRRRTLAYDVAVDEAKLRRIECAFARPLPPSRRGGSGRHIFILGLPRSGTTLTERILGALPGVRSNGETNHLATALLRHAPPSEGDIFDRAARAAPDRVAEEYDRLALAGGGAGHVIEKLPMNYLYVGAIAAALPEAPVIWVRREPVDSCFAMYRTLFGAAYPFSYDFDDLARYFAAHAALMRHWSATLPGRLIEVQYEDLVRAPVEVGAMLADRCGLDWLADALDLSRNRSASLTASATQVRGGIYTSSAGVWRRYASELQPLVDRLERLGIV